MYDPLKQEEEKYKYNHLFTANLKFPLNNKSAINSSFIFILDFSFPFFFYQISRFPNLLSISCSRKKLLKDKRDIIPLRRINFYSPLTRTRTFYAVYRCFQDFHLFFKHTMGALETRFHQEIKQHEFQFDTR